MPKQKPERGFTLLEAMVSMAIGLIVMAAMASLFKTAMNSTMLVTQRAETQQNMRAAIDLMVKDISLAGAGLPSGGIQLPTGAGATASKFGCDQAGTCHVPAHTYPTANYMYGILPGYQQRRGSERGRSRRAGGDQRQHHLDLCRLQLPAVRVQRNLHRSGQWRLHHAGANRDLRPGASRHQFRWRHSGWRPHHAQQQPG